MMKRASLLLFLAAINTGHTANVTQINRYATVANSPTTAQINPLEAVQQVHFPKEVQTIGQAVEWWLHYSGYHLVAKEKRLVPLESLMTQPLPQVQRHLGPLRVKDGLEVLVGQTIFTVVDDPLLREVNFKFKQTFQNSLKRRSV